MAPASSPHNLDHIDMDMFQFDMALDWCPISPEKKPAEPSVEAEASPMNLGSVHPDDAAHYPIDAAAILNLQAQLSAAAMALAPLTNTTTGTRRNQGRPAVRYTPEQRKVVIARWMIKRTRRHLTPRIKYAHHKRVADGKVRNGSGRFEKKQKLAPTPAPVAAAVKVEVKKVDTDDNTCWLASLFSNEE